MTTFGLAAYIATGLAFTGLAILLAASWRGRTQGGLMLFAAAATAIWSFLLAYQSQTLIPVDRIYLAELVRNAGWLTFLVAALRLLGNDAVTFTLRYAVLALWGVILIGWLSVAAIIGPGLGAGTAEQAFIVSAFLLALGGLVLVEQLYRNAPAEQRWALVYLCLGIGGLFAYDLVMYAPALLFGEIPSNFWNARGAVNVVVVPLLVVAARRNPQWSLDVFVSRQMVFYSASVISVGCYVVAVAIGSYYIRTYGGDWGSAAQVAFLFGTALILIAMLVSDQLRAHLKVFLNKHFYSNRYDYREEWLRLIATMSDGDGGSGLAERAIRAVAQIVDSVEGGLWVRRDDQLVPRGGSLGEPGEASVSTNSALFRFLERSRWIIDLEDYRSDKRLYEGVELPAWLIEQQRAWLLVPLVLEGRIYGFMLIGHPRVRHRLGWEDHDLLKTVGRQVATYLALDDAARTLTETSQFQAFNRLTAFIMHDLKNLIAQQSLVVRNATRHKDNPEFFEDAIRTVENSVGRMNRLLGQLQRGDDGGSPGTADLHGVCERALAQCADRQPLPEFSSDVPKSVIAEINPERLVQVVTHLVKNAQEATEDTGRVRVTLSRIGADAVIKIADNGIGMEASFVRDRLFRPFDSTKGSQGMGIGAYQAREFLRLAGGSISVDSQPGTGTVITVVLPVSGSTRAEEQLEQAGAGV